MAFRLKSLRPVSILKLVVYFLFICKIFNTRFRAARKLNMQVQLMTSATHCTCIIELSTLQLALICVLVLLFSKLSINPVLIVYGSTGINYSGLPSRNYHGIINQTCTICFCCFVYLNMYFRNTNLHLEVKEINETYQPMCCSRRGCLGYNMSLQATGL